MKRSSLIVLMIAALGATVTAQRGVSIKHALSVEDIQEAIRFGFTGTPTPYSLASVFPNQAEPAALAYTPWVRIAIAARKASDQATTFTVEDARQEATSSLVHVVMNSVRAESGLTDDDAISMQILPRLDTRLIGTAQGQTVDRVTTDPNRREPILAGCSECGVVVGAFKPEHLCGGCYIVVYRLRRDPGGHKIAGFFAAVLPPEGAENWR